MDKVAEQRTILITGASGFIGSFLVDEAIGQGYKVYAGVRRSSNRQFLQYPDLGFVELDYSSVNDLSQQLTKLASDGTRFDYVVHNAGITHARKNESFHKTNYEYVRNFADALAASDHPLKKFVLVSSLAAYGPGDASSLCPIKLTDQQRPMSKYGESKFLAQSYISSKENFPYLVINPTAVYGPRDKAFLQFVQLIRSGFEPYIGRNKQMISMIYVKDLARAIITLAGADVFNRSFIVSDGHSYDKQDMGVITRSALNKKTFKVKLPLSLTKATVGVIDSIHKAVKGYEPFLNKEKIDEISQANWLCDSSEVWAALNQQPEYDLDKGLRETIEWYKENNWL